MTKDDAIALSDRVQKALPDCVVLIYDRGFGVGYVVTVEQLAVPENVLAALKDGRP